MALILRRGKKQIEDLAKELNRFFQFDNIFFLQSVPCDGPLSKLDLDTLKDIQVAGGHISESNNYSKDAKRRYLLMPHRLLHLLVAIHVQNNHVGYARDKQTLADYAIVGHVQEGIKRVRVCV